MNKFTYSLMLKFGFSYIHWVGETTKWKVLGEENYLLERCKGKPIIFVFWHNQLMVMPFCYAALIRRKTATALSSLSKDGQIVSDLVEKFGYHSIRGSSSRGGGPALIKLMRQLEDGDDLVITPDGPRGPRYKAQNGVISIASASGCPILPVACDFKYQKILSSWDRFKIPRPYNEGSLVIGRPVYVEAHASDAYLNFKLIELQEVMDEVNGKAEELVKSSTSYIVRRTS